MDAELKGIKIAPAHFDKFGEIDRDEYATLTLNVPMDTEESKDWVAGLFQYLSKKYITVEIDEMQIPIPGIEAKTSTQSASLSADDAEKQMEVAKEVAEAAD